MTSRLDEKVFAALAVVFTFGIATLWLPEFWPWAAFQSALLIVAAICLFCYAGKQVELALTWPLALPFIPALLGVLQLGLSTSADPWLTRRTVLEWATYATASSLAFLVCRNPLLLNRALRFFAIGGAALALLSTIQNYSAPTRVLWLFDSGQQEATFGPFLYHTKLANFAELGIPVALWLAVTERRHRGLFFTCAVVLGGAVVAAAASRGGILILAIEFVVLGLMLIRSHSHTRVLGMALVAMVTIAYAISVFGWELAFQRFALIDPRDDLRWPIASTSIEMARHYWLTGSGLGTWSTVYPEFARFDLHLFINQAHCDWLQWLVEGGIGLPACLAWMFALSIRAARSQWWTLGLVFVWAHGLIDYPMQQTPAFACLQIAFWGASVAVLSKQQLNRVQ